MEIKVNDLVWVATTCCDGTAKEVGGKIGKVRRFETTPYRCKHCGESGNEPRAYAFSDAYRCAPVRWLKKIDPPSTGELSGVPLRLKEPV